MSISDSEIINLIAESCPIWFDITTSNDYKFHGIANIQDSISKNNDKFNLEISGIKGELKAKEIEKQSRLPSFCPERHINIDQSFCLGLSSEIKVRNNQEASVWWECLNNFLINQIIADKTGRFPNQDSLSHGSAAKHQIKAEKAACWLGLAEEYQKSMFSPSSWLKAIVDEISERNGIYIPSDIERIRSKVEPNVHKHGKRQKTINKKIKKMLSAELSRREGERLFWKLCDENNTLKCCQTMPQCPLQKTSTN